jgi:hypothetical protein
MIVGPHLDHLLRQLALVIHADAILQDTAHQGIRALETECAPKRLDLFFLGLHIVHGVFRLCMDDTVAVSVHSTDRTRCVLAHPAIKLYVVQRDDR